MRLVLLLFSCLVLLGCHEDAVSTEVKQEAITLLESIQVEPLPELEPVPLYDLLPTHDEDFQDTSPKTIKSKWQVCGNLVIGKKWLIVLRDKKGNFDLVSQDSQLSNYDASVKHIDGGGVTLVFPDGQEQQIDFTLQPAKADKKITLKFDDVPLKEAIQAIAKLLNINVILSDHIDERVSLDLQHVSLATLWQVLLTTHGLAKLSMGDAIYIASVDEVSVLVSKESLNEQSSWQQLSLQYRDVADFKELLESSHVLPAQAKLATDKSNNKLWLKCTQACVQQAKELQHAFDVPSHQIRIEARIAYVDKDFEHELGLLFADPDANAANLSSDSESLVSSDAMVFHLVDSDKLDVELAALEKDGHGEVISRPSLLTLNRQPALIQAGEEVPYQESAENGATTVRFKKAVLSLNVTPELRSNHKVLLKLTVNQDKPSSQMISGVPEINTQEIKTVAEVDSGSTVVLGGIYEESTGDGYRKIPGLSQLPFIGGLFTYKKQVHAKRQLLIFITPLIVSGAKQEGTKDNK